MMTLDKYNYHRKNGLFMTIQSCHKIIFRINLLKTSLPEKENPTHLTNTT